MVAGAVADTSRVWTTTPRQLAAAFARLCSASCFRGRSKTPPRALPVTCRRRRSFFRRRSGRGSLQVVWNCWSRLVRGATQLQLEVGTQLEQLCAPGAREKNSCCNWRLASASAEEKSTHGRCGRVALGLEPLLPSLQSSVESAGG